MNKKYSFWLVTAAVLIPFLFQACYAKGNYRFNVKDSEDESYRFNESGDPVGQTVAPKAKKGKKKKKKSSAKNAAKTETAKAKADDTSATASAKTEKPKLVPMKSYADQENEKKAAKQQQGAQNMLSGAAGAAGQQQNAGAGGATPDISSILGMAGKK